MTRLADAVERVRKGLQEIGRMLDDGPYLIIDAEGRAWLSESAEAVIRQKKIYQEDLLEWIRAGMEHLQKLSFLDLDMDILRLPGGDSLILLKSKPAGGEALKLTYKEKEVLGFLVKGFSNKEIASSMSVSPGTVNTHLDNIYRKFGCSNRLEACFLALKSGFSAPAKGKGKSFK